MTWISKSLFFFRSIHGHCHSGIAGNVQAGTEHIQHTVNACYQRQPFHGKAYGLEHHGQHNESRTGNAGGTDGSQGTGEDDHHHLVHGQGNAEYVSNEKGADAHVQRRAVHVDGGAQRQDERGDIPLHSQFRLHILHIHRKGAGGRAGGKGNGHGFRHAPEEGERAHVSRYSRKGRIHAYRMDNAAYSHADNDRQKRQEHLGTILYHHRKEEAEHAYRRGFHNHADNLVAYFRRCVEEGNQSFRPFAANGDNAGAYEEGEDNDRKDIGLA